MEFPTMSSSIVWGGGPPKVRLDVCFYFCKHSLSFCSGILQCWSTKTRNYSLARHIQGCMTKNQEATLPCIQSREKVKKHSKIWMPLAPTFTPELDPVLRKVLEKLRGSTYVLTNKIGSPCACNHTLQSTTKCADSICLNGLDIGGCHSILQVIRVLVIRVMKQRSLWVLLLLLKHLWSLTLITAHSNIFGNSFHLYVIYVQHILSLQEQKAAETQIAG